MKSDDNRNLLLAITLSVIVMVGWNYFFGMPKLEQQRQQQVQGQTATGQPGSAVLQPPGSGAANTAGTPAGPGSTVAAGAKLPRAQALALSPRVRIESPNLSGSIALIGGRIDDLSLVRYRETVEIGSPNIVLFAPQGAQDAYFADFGWLPAAGQNVAVPGPDTRWQANAEILRPGGTVTLTYDNGQGLVFTRVIGMDDKFLFTVTDSVKNTGGNPIALSSYGRISRHGTPTVLGFFILHEGLIGFLDEKLQEMSFADAVKTKSKTFTTNNKGGWLGITEKYWASALIPPHDKPFSAAFGASGAATSPVYETAAINEATTIAPGAELTATMRLFAGAKEVNVIDGYQEALKAQSFDRLVDWGWFYFITKPLFRLMDWVFHLVGNFGVTILIVTVLIKLALFPLANKSYESMARMKHVQPEMLAIRDRYADDKMKQQQAMMELYKKEKINPLAGCLPVLVQIPIFFALYKVLFVTIEMRHAPFFGWIRDLAAPDPTSIFNLFGLLPFNPGAVPVFGPFLMLGIWPIIMGITMWVQMKMNPEPTDPIQKAVFAWMPLLFTFMLASFPAGLVIYWAWNNTLSVLQQYAIMKKLGTKVELWDNLKSTFRRG
ncbi:MAG: membrane protein insertase YidC [Hyphomicrobiales bacterium]|nr:membrane protein insertase YidC [Hyphomicrobiales bacterium]